MSKLEDEEELAISLDITSRMALFALALAVPADDLATVFESIEKSLDDAGYDPVKLSKLIETYKSSAIQFRTLVDDNNGRVN